MLLGVIIKEFSIISVLTTCYISLVDNDIYLFVERLKEIHWYKMYKFQNCR